MTVHVALKDLRAAIPAFNAGKTLGKVLEGVTQLLEPEQIIVVDDGSSDCTSAVAQHYNTVLLRHGVNRGKGAALKTAFQYVLERTSAQAVISLDADGQHLPQELPAFAEAFARTRAGLIIGARNFDVRLMPWPRVLSNRITSALLSWKIGQHVKDSQSGYRLYARVLLEKLHLHTYGYETESEIIIQAGRLGVKIAFVPITTVYNGEISHIRGLRDIRRFAEVYLKA